jgi:hypothetical protein
MKWNGFIGEFGEKVGKPDMSAILAKLSDVTPLKLGLDLSIPDPGVAPEPGTFDMFVGEFVVIGVGFIMTGVGFIMTGIGFIMPPMPVIPDAIDSRSLRSSDSTKIDAFRRDLRAIMLCRCCSSCDFIGLILCDGARDLAVTL